MNNSFDKIHYTNFHDQNQHSSNHSYLMPETIQHTFGQRNPQSDSHTQMDTHGNDSRTEDQVMNNLNFSIQDLLSKISKATAEFQQHPKFTKPQSKQEYPAVFKLSNLSASTETTSKKQKSEPYIEKYEENAEGTRKSQPNSELSDKTVRNALGQKQTSLYHPNPQSGKLQRNQFRSQTYNEWKSPRRNQEQTKNYINEEYKTENKTEIINNQWTRKSARNQTQPPVSTEWGRNSSRNQYLQENKNPYFQQFKDFQTTLEWGRNSSRNQQTQNQFSTEWKKSNEWEHDYSKNQFKTDYQNQWKTFETKAHERTMNSQKTLFKTESIQEIQRKNMYKTQTDIDNPRNVFPTSEKKQFISKPQIDISSEHSAWNLSATTSPKNQIKNLLNPFQTSSFGNGNLSRDRTQKKSIIFQDDNSAQQYRPVPVSSGGKVNSLFDGRKIREVAASTIMQSPGSNDKNKKQSPFMQILHTNSPKIDQSANEHLVEPFGETPSIKINTIQKSEIIPPPRKLTIQDFHLGKELGSGKFGDVYQAVHKTTGALYAIKKIFKSTIQQYNMIEQFTRELKIHYSLNYPNIIKLYTHFDDEYHIFLVMEYGEGGMLMEKIKNGEKFSSLIVQQMLRAVEHLHNKKIAHRDIKPENIVLMFGDTAKLCDFGWSRVFDSDMKKTFCGTLDYVSPQMKDKGEYSLKIDIWSLGVLTFELLCGFAPFKDEITNWKKKGGNMNKAWNWNILYPPEISSVAESFMRNLLKENAEQRANIRFCLNHLFIRKYNQMSFNPEEENRFREASIVLRDQ